MSIGGSKGLSRAFLAVAAAIATGCAANSGLQPTAGVRVVSNEQEVAGCELVINVRVVDAVSRDQARVELERLAKDRGANVLLLPASGDGNSGTAYRCSGKAPATAATN